MQFIKQFIGFGLVGVINTSIGLVIYYLFIWINTDWYIWGNMVGFVVSTFNAYICNSKFVFKVEKQPDDLPKKFLRTTKSEIFKTYLSYATTLCLSTVLLYIWVDIFNISAAVAPIINLFITIPLNFIMNKYWVYKTKKV